MMVGRGDASSWPVRAAGAASKPAGELELARRTSALALHRRSRIAAGPTLMGLV